MHVAWTRCLIKIEKTIGDLDSVHDGEIATAVRDVDAGSTVSYGATWTAPGPARLATLAIAFLARKVTGDTVEPEEGPSALPQVSITIRDAEGKPVLYQEK